VIVTSTAAIRNKLMILLLIWKKAVFGYAARRSELRFFVARAGNVRMVFR